MNDLKNLNNVSALLSPIIKEIDNVIKGVLVEVEEGLKEAGKIHAFSFSSLSITNLSISS